MPSKLSQSEWNERKNAVSSGSHWCSLCKQYKTVDNFSKNKNSWFGYHNWCKNCHNGKRRGNPVVKKRARQYNRELKSYYKSLLGGKCAKCGYNKTQVSLEFHHVEPGEKEGLVTKLINNNDHDKIIAEMDKCILLCRNCHQELESYCWSAEFIKNDELGYKIKPDSIKEDEVEFWTKPSDKVLYSQPSLINGMV